MREDMPSHCVRRLTKRWLELTLDSRGKQSNSGTRDGNRCGATDSGLTFNNTLSTVLRVFGFCAKRLLTIVEQL